MIIYALLAAVLVLMVVTSVSKIDFSNGKRR